MRDISLESTYQSALLKRFTQMPVKNRLYILKEEFIHYVTALPHNFWSKALIFGYIQELSGHASSKTTDIYTHVAAHRIIAIRSPIVGLLK